MKKTLILSVLILLLFCQNNYGQNYKLDSLHISSWNTNTTLWHHNTRELYSYANDGDKETNILRLIKNNTSWDNFFQKNKTYDIDNNRTLSIKQDWDSSLDIWEDKTQETYLFDDNQNETEYIKLFYFSSVWNNNMKINSTYSAQGITQRTQQNYDSGAYHNAERLTYTYNDSDILTNFTKERWVTYLTEWEYVEQITFTYTEGLLSQKEVIRFNISTQSWNTYPLQQYNYLYDDSDNLIESTELLWIASISELRNYKHILNTYTSNNLVELIRQDWVSSTEMWENKSKEINSYDAFNNKTENILQIWDETTTVWENYLRYGYFWSETTPFSLLVTSNDIEKFSIYPNPTNANAKIIINNSIQKEIVVAIYTINGKIIAKYNTSESTTHINTENFITGLYVVKIKSGTREETKKLIIN